MTLALRSAFARCEMTIRPEDVFIERTPPLTGVFGKTEREVAAAFMLMAYRFHNKKWQESVMPKEIGAAMRDKIVDIKAGVTEEGYEWMGNPFCRPDVYGLVADGFAKFGNEDHDWMKCSVQFTHLGLMVMQASSWAPKK